MSNFEISHFNLFLLQFFPVINECFPKTFVIFLYNFRLLFQQKLKCYCTEAHKCCFLSKKNIYKQDTVGNESGKTWKKSAAIIQYKHFNK